MLFSSAIFLFLFLPIVLTIYYLSPDRFRNIILLTSSLFFYTWGETYLVLVMLTTIVVDFFAAIVIENGRRRLGLLVSLISNLSLLGFFKYFNFGIESFLSIAQFFGFDKTSFPTFPAIALPLGISFYTFQSLSYTIDVYRGHIKANRNILNFAAFVTVFPQLIAGPIVRYIDVEKQFQVKNLSVDKFSIGVRRFIIGLSKKMLLANPCATVADYVFNTPIQDLSTGWAWIGILAYTFQIYFDFSGYSDMAIGLAKMLGFDFHENFNLPYISKSIREFWQRWHISLSTWFRDYLYIPLGGSRVRPLLIYRNLIIVFFVTGLWHGASWNFIIWGLFHGLFLILERIGLQRLLEKSWTGVQHFYALLVVVIGWVFFRAESLSFAVSFLGKMFSFQPGDPARSSYLHYFVVNNEYLLVGVGALIFSTSWPSNLIAQVDEKVKTGVAWGIAELLLLVSGFILSCSFIAGDSYNPFIYFRF